MKIDLKKYYEERENLKLHPQKDGPFITFSREYGCEANRIARLLISKLNELPTALGKRQPWKYISKEILDESARELKLEVRDLDERIQSHSPDALTNIFASFNHHYTVNDQVILDKVKDILTTYAKKGNVILVGRGSGSVTQEIENGLRIRLIAPLEWRAERIGKKMSINSKEAIRLVNHFDERRLSWMHHLSGKPYNQNIYDLVINTQKVTDKELLTMIIQLMESRGMIQAKEGNVSGRLKSLV